MPMRKSDERTGNAFDEIRPTRNDLNEKIEGEAKKVFGSASPDDLTGFRSEVEVKYRIRNELKETFMSDETVSALMSKNDVLDGIYRFCLEKDGFDRISLAVCDWLEKAEGERVSKNRENGFEHCSEDEDDCEWEI
jgi:hypothetical protein